MIQAIKTTEATPEWLHVFQTHEFATARINMVEQVFEDPAILADQYGQNHEPPQRRNDQAPEKALVSVQAPGR